MCRRRNLYLFGFFQVSWIKWHPAQVAVSWGQAWEQSNFLHPHSRKSPRRWERFSESPRGGQLPPQLRWGSVATLPTRYFIHFPQPRAEFSPLLLRIHETEKLFYPNCQQKEFISTSPATGKTNYDREKKLMFTVCFAGLFLICPETTTQPSLWH